MHHITKVINIIIRPKYCYYLITDASNGYLAIWIKPRDEYKTGFVTLYDQYVYLQMDQDLIDASYTYSQFNNMIFGYLPKNQKSLAQAMFIRDYSN